MKNIVLIVLLLLSVSSFTQEIVRPSDDFEVFPDHVSTMRFVDLEDGKVLWFTHKAKTELGVYVFDNTMNLLEKKTIESTLVGYDYIVDVQEVNGELYFLFARYNPEEVKESLTVRKFDVASLSLEGEEKVIVAVNDKLKSTYFEGERPAAIPYQRWSVKFAVKKSADDSGFLIVYKTLMQHKAKNTGYSVLKTDLHFNVIWSNEFTFSTLKKKMGRIKIIAGNNSVIFTARTWSKKSTVYDGIETRIVTEDEGIKPLIPTNTSYSYVYPNFYSTNNGEQVLINCNGTKPQQEEIGMTGIREMEFFVFNEKTKELELLKTIDLEEFLNVNVEDDNSSNISLQSVLVNSKNEFLINISMLSPENIILGNKTIRFSRDGDVFSDNRSKTPRSGNPITMKDKTVCLDYNSRFNDYMKKQDLEIAIETVSMLGEDEERIDLGVFPASDDFVPNLDKLYVGEKRIYFELVPRSSLDYPAVPCKMPIPAFIRID